VTIYGHSVLASSSVSSNSIQLIMMENEYQYQWRGISNSLLYSWEDNLVSIALAVCFRLRCINLWTQWPENGVNSEHPTYVHVRVCHPLLW